MSERLEIPSMLYRREKSYRTILEETEASLTTITRIAKFLKGKKITAIK